MVIPFNKISNKILEVLEMKIIQEGKKIINQQEVTCPKCEAKLIVCPEDLERTPTYGTYFYVCPCCGRRHSLIQKYLNEDMKFGLGLSK